MFKEDYVKMNENISPDKKLIKSTKEKMYKYKSKSINFSLVLASMVLLTFCLVLGLSYLLDKNNTNIDNSIANNTNNNESKILTALSDNQVTENVKLSNGDLYFSNNNIERMNGDFAYKYNFDTDKFTKEVWDNNKVISYLGKDPRPSYIPQGLIQFAQNEHNIYIEKENNKIFSNFAYVYSENFNDEYEPLKKEIVIEVAKGELPIKCSIYLDEYNIKSNINGTVIGVGYNKMGYGYVTPDKKPTGYYDLYFSDFIYDGIGYSITAKNTTQQEFINILTSIIK